MSYESETKAYFKKYASAKSKRSKLYDFKLELLDRYLRKPFRVLDAGCGNGDFTIPVSRKAYVVYAVDFSNEMLAELRKRARTKNIDILRQDLTKLDFPNSFFDLAFSFSTIYYIREQERVFKEINRVLKPNGLFIFDVGNINSLSAKYYKRRYKVQQFFSSWNAYQDLLAQTGFEIIKEHCFEAVPRVNLPFLQDLLDLSADGRLFDEIISSVAKDFAFRKILVCKKVEECPN
jgi:ubiquinone/menaquinone biosynthesis C-methylase UbiE